MNIINTELHDVSLIIATYNEEESLGYVLDEIKDFNIGEIIIIDKSSTDNTKNIAENVNIDLENFENIRNFIINNKIDLVVVGPEKPLVEGLVDYLERFKIKVFGPNKFASQLEGSKIFTKQICKKFNIPTAKFGIFENEDKAIKLLKSTNFPTVIKADNLASGKGVYICNSKNEAYVAIDEIFNGKFGKAEKLLIEEFLIGEEMSFFTIHDGKVFKNFGRDHVSNGHAIANMALENYIEMRDLVNDEDYKNYRKMELNLEKKFPDRFIPRYSMVSFNEISYSEVYQRGEIQSKIIKDFISGKISKIERDKMILDQLKPKIF